MELTRAQAIGNILSAYAMLYVKIGNADTDGDELSSEVYDSLVMLGVNPAEIASVLVDMRREVAERWDAA